MGKTDYVPSVPKLPTFPTFPTFPIVRQSSCEKSPWKFAFKLGTELANILFLVPRGQTHPAVSIPKAKRPSLFSKEQPERPGLPGVLYLCLSLGLTPAMRSR